MADANDEGDELTEIIVTAPDSGGYGSNGGGGGGYVGDLWANWVDSFVWAGFYNGPDQAGGGESNGQDEPPEIVVTAPEAPPPAPVNDLAATLAALINNLNYQQPGDWEGFYRLNVLGDQNGDDLEIRLDILNPETLVVDTYIMTDTSAYNYSTPADQQYDFPDQGFKHAGPQDAPDQWNWA